MRDGVVVTQVAARQATIGNLAAKATHDWTIAAVDTRGYASAPSRATRVTQAAPPPTAGGVQTFLLASTDASFAAFRKHYNQVSVVYPTFYDCRANGEITGANDARIVSFAQDRRGARAAALQLPERRHAPPHPHRVRACATTGSTR